MARVLLLQPNRWGRGITSIWIPAHAAALRDAGHEVRLFDATFYRDWSQDENRYNTLNKQYRPTDYERFIVWSDTPVGEALQGAIDAFAPDVVFWAALSSHIHGEGEYVNIQHGHELMQRVRSTALHVAGGLQATAAPELVLDRFAGLDALITGESDLVLPRVASAVAAGARDRLAEIEGTAVRAPGGSILRGPRQPLIRDLDSIGAYDYSVFDPQVFWRPYNGDVVRAADYELSRGCMFTCTYCVETVVQRHYGFTEASTTSGALRDAKGYLRHKSAARIIAELQALHDEHGVRLVRCQDTNFLTIHRPTLLELADRLDAADLDLRLYIETRVDRMSERDFELLPRLRVDGVGTGLELASESFREDRLRRFAQTEKLRENFARLRALGIKRTTYNIIGLPHETEEMVHETIDLNRQLDPDNVTVAFYSPYLGTIEAEVGREADDFGDYELDVDGQLRTRSRSALLDRDTLEFYKAHFVDLMRDGFGQLETLKREYGLSSCPSSSAAGR